MRTDSSGRWIIAAALLATGLPQIANAIATSPTIETKSPEGAKGGQQAAAVYTCSMHPEVISDKPGKCPKCGMKLVPKAGATPAPDKK